MIDPRNLWVQAASLYLLKWESRAFSWVLSLIINNRGCSAVVRRLTIFSWSCLYPKLRSSTELDAVCPEDSEQLLVFLFFYSFHLS